MTKPIEASEMLDSRDIIERLEELTEHFEALHEQETEEGKTALTFDDWLKALPDDYDDYLAEFEHLGEYKQLCDLQNECEDYADWGHGVQLIREDYFTDCIEELIKDCYPLPKEIDSGRWPYRHMTIDYEAAADEAKCDYAEAEFMGHTYFIQA
jgi:hypothetical protein